MSPPEPDPPPEPDADPPRPLLSPAFWIAMAVGLLAILAGVGVVLLGPR